MENVFLVRHGESVANVKKLYGTDLPLTGTGEIQARELGLKFLDIKYNLVLSSPKIRAVDTAKIAFPDVPIIYRPELSEIYFGALEGDEVTQTWSEIANCPNKVLTDYHGDNVLIRAEKAIKVINKFAKPVLGNLIVVTHGLLIEAIKYRLSGKDWNEYKFFKDVPAVKNCGYIKLRKTDFEA